MGDNDPVLVDHKTDACVSWKGCPTSYALFFWSEMNVKELEAFASCLLVRLPGDEVRPDVVVKE